MRGPKPKPLELRVLHGKAGEARLAEYPRARRAQNTPPCPEHLTEDEARYWKQSARELHDAGLFTVLDRWAFEQLCTAHARRLRAHAMVKSAEVIRTSPVLDADGNMIGGGNFIQNPWLAIENKAAEHELKLMAEFGMTPSSRSRVKAEISAAKAQRQAERPRIVATEDADIDPRKVLNG